MNALLKVLVKYMLFYFSNSFELILSSFKGNYERLQAEAEILKEKNSKLEAEAHKLECNLLKLKMDFSEEAVLLNRILIFPIF